MSVTEMTDIPTPPPPPLTPRVLFLRSEIIYSYVGRGALSFQRLFLVMKKEASMKGYGHFLKNIEKSKK